MGLRASKASAGGSGGGKASAGGSGDGKGSADGSGGFRWRAVPASAGGSGGKGSADGSGGGGVNFLDLLPAEVQAKICAGLSIADTLHVLLSLQPAPRERLAACVAFVLVLDRNNQLHDGCDDSGSYFAYGPMLPRKLVAHMNEIRPRIERLHFVSSSSMATGLTKKHNRRLSLLNQRKAFVQWLNLTDLKHLDMADLTCEVVPAAEYIWKKFRNLPSLRLGYVSVDEAKKVAAIVERMKRLKSLEIVFFDSQPDYKRPEPFCLRSASLESVSVSVANTGTGHAILFSLDLDLPKCREFSLGRRSPLHCESSGRGLQRSVGLRSPPPAARCSFPRCPLSPLPAVVFPVKAVARLYRLAYRRLPQLRRFQGFHCGQPGGEKCLDAGEEGEKWLEAADRREKERLEAWARESFEAEWSASEHGAASAADDDADSQRRRWLDIKAILDDGCEWPRDCRESCCK